jgi:perosamine synthetase
MPRHVIPLSRADIGPAERRAVLRVLRSGRLALGPQATRFEQQVADYVGVGHGVAVSSGTAGLHLVVRALGLGPGDEVITSSYSFVASVNCLLYEGVRPVFADIDQDTLCLDPALVEQKITRRTRAILAVDVFGHPADWPALETIARRHGLALIEDSCEALGSALGARRCGSFGDAAVFAFYPNKQITTGEGGMVVTRRRRIAELCRSMANQGRRAAGFGSRWLEHVRLGYNYRMSELAAALGSAQMERLGEIVARRQQVASRYDRLLADLPDVSVPYRAPGAYVSPFVYCVRLAPHLGRAGRDRVIARLRREGIECADYFRPIHEQPYFLRRTRLPITEETGSLTIALPFHNRLPPAQQHRVTAALAHALRAEARNPRRNRAAG